MVLNINVLLFIFYLLPVFGTNAYALDSVKKSVVVLNDTRSGFPMGNFCSGFIVEHNSKQYLVTASHCFTSNERMNHTRVIQGYTSELLELHFQSKAPPSDGKIDSIAKLEAQLEALEFESRSLNDEGILQSESIKAVELGSPLVINEAIDFAVFNLPTNSSFKSIELESQLSDFSLKGSFKLELYGHPGGQTLRTSAVCDSHENKPLEDDFLFNSNCKVSGGNSGGPITSPGGNRALGIVISHKLKSDALVINAFTQNSSYFPAIARALLENLNGNLNVGIRSEKGKYWLSLDGAVKLRLRLDLDDLTYSEQKDFYRITKLLSDLAKTKPHGNALSEYSMTIYKTAQEAQASDRALSLGDSPEEVSKKVDNLLIFLFGK